MDRFLNKIEGTRFAGQAYSLLNHVQQVPEVLFCGGQALHMVLHPNHQNRASESVMATESVFARSVYFGDDFLFLGDGIWLEILIPLDPLDPHFGDLFLLEVPGDTESSDGVDVGVEVAAVLEVLEVGGEVLGDDLVLGLDLGQFAVGYSQRVVLIHFNYGLEKDQYQLQLLPNPSQLKISISALQLNPISEDQSLIRICSSYKMEPKPQRKREFPVEEAEPIVGPNPRKLQKIDLYDLVLENLPSAENYEISYMHRDIVSNVIAATKSEYIITFSIDGHVKFWKKAFNLVEFVKNYKAHSGLITCAALSKNQDYLCTVGIDKTLKIFEVLTCDLRTVIKLPFSPSACEFLPRQGCDEPYIAVSEEKSGRIMIISPEVNNYVEEVKDEENQVLGQEAKHRNEEEETVKWKDNIVRTLNLHRHPIRMIKMNWSLGFCLSTDERGFLEIWDPLTFDFPTFTAYKYKMQTDFLELLKQNSIPVAMNISPKGKYLAVYFKDRFIKVLNLITGKMVLTINESIKEITQIQEDNTHERYGEESLDEAEFHKKMGIQKEIEMTKQYLNTPQLDFDESEEFLIYPSFRGIKIYSMSRRCVERILGKKEHERFIKVVLYQGKVMRNPSGNSNSSGQRRSADPTIYCTSFKRPRFYIFSRRSPEVGPENDIVRDIINEKITKEDHAAEKQLTLTEKQNQVIFNTTLGDIHLLLFLEDCPKTCENFIKLAKKGYYNNTIFHRVIKGFMNQGGCPKGDGTGGQSIWGATFEDQLCPDKHRFDRPYMLAMANRGPNTNGSQFFITVVACPWLDNKHTVFGRVTKGIETVCEINKLKTDKTESPLMAVKITSAQVR